MTERAAPNVPGIRRRRGLLAGVVALCLVVLGVAEGMVENAGFGSPYPGLLAALLPALASLLLFRGARTAAAAGGAPAPGPGGGLFYGSVVGGLVCYALFGGVVAYRAHVAFHEERGRLVAARSDLRDLRSAQEVYYGDGNYVYADHIDVLGMVESEGVHVGIVSHGPDGFGATATHDGVPDRRCAVYYGDAHRIRPATEPGVVVCN